MAEVWPALKKSALTYWKTTCYNPFPEYTYHTTIPAAQNVLLGRLMYCWHPLNNYNLEIRLNQGTLIKIGARLV